MLSALRKMASSCSNYIRMKDLEPGRYEVSKFSLRDSKFGGKCLVIDIPEKGFMYLPQGMTEEFNTEEAVIKLNEGHYDFVYKGKYDFTPYNTDFTFELHYDDTDDDESFPGFDEVAVDEAQKLIRDRSRKRTYNDEGDFVDAGPKKTGKTSKNASKNQKN